MSEQVGAIIGFVLTLMIASYLVRDNALYRLAVYIAIGLSAGYFAVVTVENVLVPWVQTTVLSADPLGQAVGITALALGATLLLKPVRQLRGIGSIGLAFLVGVGAAVAVVGAVSGTLLPIAGSTADGVSSDAINGFLVVLGVISVLLYFQYRARRGAGGVIRRGLVARVFGVVGEGVIAITFGALYAGAILSALVVTVDRLGVILAQIAGG